MPRASSLVEDTRRSIAGLAAGAVLLTVAAGASAQPTPGSAHRDVAKELREAALPEIVIDGSIQDPRKLPLVLDAIKGRLCPCFQWRVEEGQIVNGGRVNEGGREQMIPSYCECYRQHTVGCNLILDLVGDDEEITIGDEANAGSSYWIRAGPQGNNARTLKLNLDKEQQVPTTDGSQEQSRAERLAHELVHAHHHLNDNVARDDPNEQLTENNYDRAGEERNATRGTNQIREEIGEDERTEYGLGGGSLHIDPEAADPHLDDSQRFCD